MKSLDLFSLRLFATIVFIVSLDSIRIDCALHEAMIKVHPIAEWWVSKLLCISQSIKMGPSFVHPCCVCTLTWQLSAKSSHGMPPYIVYTNFRMRSAMINFAPKHYLTTLVIDFSLSFGHTGPGYSMPSPASSAKHVGVKKTSTPIFLTCSAHHTFFRIDEVEVAILTSGGAGLCIDWWCRKQCFLFL